MENASKFGRVRTWMQRHATTVWRSLIVLLLLWSIHESRMARSAAEEAERSADQAVSEADDAAKHAKEAVELLEAVRHDMLFR
jgi:hypothetical protein